ncbi:EAL domain-containing protein [Glycomyces sp. TRM65418]|uniref:putative bifunctional diguanylate cyclase/phosphodiesterase n=1 Tax=Glycomyces sp. TRM65418 TaxID=2867006 RepID=UPI001CE4FE57|nr:EAL domain-containing protein [Glycomyces sp. TRM65418]MCC3765395.1 EAL domain-containing protein [Glycomyces sp. TRM65418]QZD55007.1 EAL domain-containing protein [Glycomyces sp. TRM65418]
MATTLMRNTAPKEHPGRYYGFQAAVSACAVIGAAVVCVVGGTAATGTFDVPFAFWLTAGLALVAELRPTRWGGLWMSPIASIYLVYVLATMVTWGFLPAIIVQSAAIALLCAQIRATAWRTVFNASQQGLALVLAWFVWNAVADGAVWTGGAAQMLTIFAAGTVWTLTSFALVAGRQSLRTGAGWPGLFWQWFKSEWALRATQVAIAPILATAAMASWWLVAASAIPIFAVYRILQTAADRERQADRDPLTGLLNRKGFQQVVDAKITDATETGTTVAVLILDLDRFADVNSALGHEVGDQLLVELAQRFRADKPPGKAIAHLGGDEFAFTWSELDGMTDPLECAREIRARLDAPIVLGDASVEVDGSVGIAVFPDDGPDFQTLFRHADIAMYESKQRASSFARYAPEFDHHSPERLLLLGDLRRALDHPDAPGVNLFYQPQVRIVDGEVIGAEALLRYSHPERGVVNPAEIIETAEHSSVMRMLTERVVDIALRQLRSWNEAGYDLRMAVNVSVRDLQSPEFTDFLTGRIDAYGVDAAKLQLEITESALMADPRRVVVNVQRLSDLGVGISLDDFGTGFSSMQHLRRLPVTEIKIDKSFVTTLIDDPDNAAIVSTTIDLGRALDVEVVAEGVEDEKVRKQLEGWGCHAGQGWHFAKPMSADAFERWMADHRREQ